MTRRFNVRMFPRSVNFADVEVYVDESFHGNEGDDAVIAVEVFDHPDAAFSAEHDGVTGPMIVGTDDEVHAYLDWAVATQGWGEDYAEQYSAGPVEED